MTSLSNVRPFPKPSTTHQWRDRVFAAVAYIVLGFMLRGMSDSSFYLMMVLAILYWAFIQHGRVKASYFLRFHLIQCLLSFFLLDYLLHLVIAIFQTVESLCTVLGVGLPGNLEQVLLINLAYGAAMGLPGFGILMGILALAGKTPKLPLVGDAIRQWA